MCFLRRKMWNMAINEKILTPWQTEENKRLIYFPICGVTYPDRRYLIRRPRSTVACIEFIVSGCGVIHYGNQRHIVQAGDSYFLQPGADQYYHADAGDPWEKVFLNLSGPLLDKLIEGYQLQDRVCFPRLDLNKELNAVLRLTETHPGDNTQPILEQVTRMLHKMYLHDRSSARASAPAERIRIALDRSVKQHFDLAALCAEVGLSPSHAVRTFKAAYGLTPHAYFTQRKVELAKELLLSTALPITTIAQELSFADEYYFSNVFKRHTGLSPRAYRRVEKGD